MKCPACGAVNAVDADSCVDCGRPITALERLAGEEGTLRYPEESTSGADVGATRTDSGTLVADDSGTVAGLEHPPDLTFGDRYVVRKLLGRGGMGAVYLARDKELERDVALKEIRPELADQTVLLASFKREIQLASEITHPNVLRVYDLAEAEGKRFLTMQYVDGETLAAYQRRLGRLSVDRALLIFHQLCSALAAAHRKGVVHRDLKPENVMMASDGTAYVMDFGLARSLATTGLTQTGAVMGTPHYMSPEQVMGQKVDARTDVYALGVILYRLLTGELPFTGDSTFEVMMQRVQHEPRPASELNPEIPPYLRRILERCLDPDVSIRYADAGRILVDLEAQQVETRLLDQLKKRRKPLLKGALGALLALVVAAGFWLGQRSSDPRVSTAPSQAETTGEQLLPAAPSIAVVPLVNRTGNASLDWFGEGVARLLMDNLAQSRHLRVVSLDRVRTLLESGEGEITAAAAAAGIDRLLTGEILQGADGLTVTARLTDTVEGREIASRRLDGLSEAQLMQGSDELAATVRQGLGVPPTESVDVYAADFAASNPAAYSRYIEALTHWAEYRYDEAEALLDEALELAPDFTMARYRLAIVKADSSRTDEAAADIEVALREASRLPRREALYLQAAEAYIGRRYEDAILAYESLLESYPYETEARHLLAQIFDYLGRYDEEQAQLDVLARFEPDDPTLWSMQGNLALHRKNFTKAIQDLQRYIDLLPDSANGLHLLGDAYRGQGELTLAAEQYSQALELDPGFHFSTTSLAIVEFLQGREEEAEARLRALVGDTEAPHRNRIDAVFELASILRSQQRFRDAARELSSMAQIIAEEQVREAMSLSVQGTSWLEVGDYSRARDLIDQSIEKSPGVPTRYLFARGLLELAEGDLEKVGRTANRILEGALPPDDPDRTEDKAAAFLRGSALLAAGDLEASIAELSRAISLGGFAYSIYRVALAQALLAADRQMEAMAAARQAANEIDLSEPRLDLQLDRLRARLVLAEVQAAMNRPEQAAELARELLEQWSAGDPGLPDIEKARRLNADRD